MNGANYDHHHHQRARSPRALAAARATLGHAPARRAPARLGAKGWPPPRVGGLEARRRRRMCAWLAFQSVRAPPRVARAARSSSSAASRRRNESSVGK